MVSASLARRRSSSITFSLPGRISYLAFQPCSGSTPMRVNSWRLAFSLGDSAGASAAAALPRLTGSREAEPLVGRSRMWPILDFTTYWLPRYLLMVLALAGDSTMTSDLPMESRVPESRGELRRFAPQRRKPALPERSEAAFNPLHRAVHAPKGHSSSAVSRAVQRVLHCFESGRVTFALPQKHRYI